MSRIPEQRSDPGAAPDARPVNLGARLAWLAVALGGLIVAAVPFLAGPQPTTPMDVEAARWREVGALALAGVAVLAVVVAWNVLLRRKVAQRTEALEQAVRERISALDRAEQMQEARRISEGRHHAIVRTALDAVVSIDEDGRLIEFNPAAEETFGFRRDDVIGKPLTEVLVPERYRQAHVEGMARLRASGQQRILGKRIEVMGLRADGTEIDVELSVTVDRSGPVPVFTGYLRDIGERLRRERAFRESSATIRAILDTAAEGIVAVDADGHIRMINDAGAGMFGYTPRELIGRSCAMLAPGGNIAPLGTLRDRLLAGEGGGGKISVQVRGLRRDGTTFPFSLAGSTVVIGDQTQFTGVVRDLTDEQRAAQELVDARARAEAADRAKGDFLATMSHEIRTPLNAIIGTTDVALASALPAATRELLETVHASAGALLYLINDLLDFSRIDAGQLVVQSVPFDPGTLIEDATSALASRAQARGVEVICRVGPGVPARLLGDPHRIRQVVLNLLGNAIKFTEVGEIAVSIDATLDAPRRAAVTITVRDTGPGIPPEHRARIFDKFYQVDASSTRKAGGTGLGLAIAASLVECMGGTLALDSDVGRGSCFAVSLPLPVPDDAAEVVPRRTYDGLRARVVDRHRAAAEALAEHLQGAGFTVDLARDVEAAVGAPQDAGIVFVDRDTLWRAPAAARQAALAHPQRTVLVVSPGRAVAVADDPWTGPILAKPLRRSRVEHLLDTLLPRPATQDADARPALVSRPWVLLAEDTPESQRATQRLLELEGCAVDLACDGREAVEHARARRYDAIFMDLQMPNVDGYAATRAIRAEERMLGGGKAPIIALTAHALETYRTLSLEAGMDDFRTKPVQRPDIQDALLRWIDRRPVILVADDVDDNRRLLERYLAGDRWRVCFAGNGEEAFGLMQQQRIDLALIDVQMPVRDGFETARAVRAASAPRTRGIPLLALSAHDGPEHAARCVAAGFDAVLTKPISKSELLAVVERWLRGQHARPADRLAVAVAAAAVAPEPSDVARPVIVIDEDLAEIVPPFLEGRLHDVEEMGEMLGRQDYEAIRVLGHNMKGTGSSYGAHDVTRLGHEIEEAATRHDEATIASSLAALERYLRDVTVEPRAR